jgi:hypothetical protein
MTDTVRNGVRVELAYYGGEDDPARGIFKRRPIEPEHMDEMALGVYFDDDSIGVPPEIAGRPLQIELAGSARALEAFGTYLIALARLKTADSDPHEHFDELVGEHGATVQLVVRRR